MKERNKDKKKKEMENMAGAHAYYFSFIASILSVKMFICYPVHHLYKSFLSNSNKYNIGIKYIEIQIVALSLCTETLKDRNATDV